MVCENDEIVHSALGRVSNCRLFTNLMLTLASHCQFTFGDQFAGISRTNVPFQSRYLPTPVDSPNMLCTNQCSGQNLPSLKLRDTLSQRERLNLI